MSYMDLRASATYAKEGIEWWSDGSPLEFSNQLSIALYYAVPARSVIAQPCLSNLQAFYYLIYRQKGRNERKELIQVSEL